jgi:hypothetical protein
MITKKQLIEIGDSTLTWAVACFYVAYWGFIAYGALQVLFCILDAAE